jgi:hypothetical protein
MSEPLFFKPWIGADYERLRTQIEAGEFEHDVWSHPYHVMGESHYGKPEEYDPGLTRLMVERCGHHSSHGKCSAFFGKVLKIVTGQELTTLEREEHWRKLAFSNFLQDLMPGPLVPPQEHQWERGRRAFRKQLALTRPEVLLVLGQRLWGNLPRDFGFPAAEMVSMNGQVTIKEAWAYVYEQQGRKRLTLAVYVIHPSAGGGAFKWRIAAERARTAAIYYSNVEVSKEFEVCEPAMLT